MSRAPIEMEMTGFKKAIKKLSKLKKAKAKSIWRKGIRAASSSLLKRARPLVPKQSGTLKKSLAIRIKSRKGDGRIVGIVGPRQKYFKMYKCKIRKPSKYAHLVENGRKAKLKFSSRGVPFVVRGVKGRSFIAKSVKLGGSDAMSAMSSKIAEEMKKV